MSSAGYNGLLPEEKRAGWCVAQDVCRSSGELEQVQVRSFVRRPLRLELLRFGFVSALGLALVPAVFAQAVSTQTTLSVTSLESGTSQAVVNVTDADGQPGAGVVNIEESGRILAQTQLNASGQASVPLTLTSGDHSLTGVYLGDTTHQASTSVVSDLQTQVTGGTPTFQVGVTPVSPSTLPLTLTAGQSGTVQVTLTPVNNASLGNTPMFVTLSCSGLPSLASCSFTPTSLEIQSTTPATCPANSAASACPPTSLMVISTQAQTVSAVEHRNANPIAWALLLPGVLGLGGLGFAARRRWLQRLSLVALVGIVTALGMTGCNPQYYYEHHGPSLAPSTPAGNYTVTVTAQSTNGVTAITNSTTMVLTVQ
jgi:hypothetical protein